MVFFPLLNSLRIAALSCLLVFFSGIGAAFFLSRLPDGLKGPIDALLTLPMVLPPTVCGYALLLLVGADRPLGILLGGLGIRFVMNWYGGVLCAAVVSFPLMYRTARGAFEGFDEALADAGRMLGFSEWAIFWKIRVPACRKGLLSGAVLSFARGLGEYGATSMLIGYIPGRTATIATTVYHLWRTDNTAGAVGWILADLLISIVVLFFLSRIDRPPRSRGACQ